MCYATQSDLLTCLERWPAYIGISFKPISMTFVDRFDCTWKMSDAHRWPARNLPSILEVNTTNTLNIAMHLIYSKVCTRAEIAEGKVFMEHPSSQEYLLSTSMCLLDAQQIGICHCHWQYPCNIRHSKDTNFEYMTKLCSGIFVGLIHHKVDECMDCSYIIL